MKRILKFVGIAIVVIFLILLASPFLFADKLEGLLLSSINNKITAKVSWEEMEVSLFRNFPKATVSLSNYTLINQQAPFTGDTLASGDQIHIAMGVTQLFKDRADTPIQVDVLELDKPRVNIMIDSSGRANYDIVAPSNSSEGGATSSFSFDLKRYALADATVLYKDAASGLLLQLEDVTHSGSGDLSASKSKLTTTTAATVSLDLGGINYLNQHQASLEAIIGLDLDAQKYTFLENELRINALPLTFDGFVQIIDEGNLIDLSFKTPNSDFKNFLAVIPEAYAKNLDGVTTSGDFRVSGLIKGRVTQDRIPTLAIIIQSENASFKYPDLPKRMDNINIDVSILNKTGLEADTYLDINALNFKIDQDAFAITGILNNLTGNTQVNLAIDGALDLANIEKVYPLELETPLQGRIETNLSTRFDMNAIQNQQYNAIKSTGTATLSNFKYSGKQMPKPILIDQAAVNFEPGTIQLTGMTASTGATDINASGSIKNLIPFMMSKEDLKGNFSVRSKQFNLDDFSTATTQSSTQDKNAETTQASTKGIQLPDFLDATLNFNADQVRYDGILLDNVSGTLSIIEQQANVSNMSSSLFRGKVGLNGSVSTRSGLPLFDMKLDLNDIDIDQSFENLEMLRGLAPVAKALQGAFNTEINLRGQLDSHFSPQLNSIDGSAFAQLLTANINPDQSPLLATLDDRLNFINLKEVDLDQLKTTLSFKNGAVQIEPFDFSIKDIQITVAGGHSFDNTMNYRLALNVPAQYLGSDISGLLSKLTQEEKDQLTVDLPIAIGGNFASPSVNINTQAAIQNLSSQIIAIQKQRVKDKVDDKLDDLIGDVLGDITGNQPKTDSTATQTTENTTTETIKDVAGGILGNLLGKKKKQSEEPKETAKDSIKN